MKWKPILAVMILSVLAFILLFDFIKSDNEVSMEEKLRKENAATWEAMEQEAKQAETGLKEGETAPDFTLNTLDGNPVSLADFRGQKVLLNFWATWCPPCKEEMPDMQSFYEKYQDNGVEVVAVNLTFYEKQLQDVEEFTQEYGLTFPIPLDEQGEEKENYRVITIPSSYFLDENGVIQQAHIGPMTYEFMEKAMEDMD